MQEWKRYRVVATVDCGSEADVKMETEWLSSRDRAVAALESIQNGPHHAQIEVKKVQTGVDADEVPHQK